MVLNRRQFLALVAGVAAATGLPEVVVARQLAQGADPTAVQAAAERTTLAQTLQPGAANDLGFRSVVIGPGEPHVVREDLAAAQDGRETRRRSLLCFLHLTDQHLIDVQSPARVEFLDRFVADSCPPPFESAWRAHEAASVRNADAMVRQLRAIGVSPVTGAPVAAAVCTGDNTDNQQANELAWFLGVMDGGPVNPNSGDGAAYEGVQVSGDVAYWHPDRAVADRYKTVYGFPAREGFLLEALAPFTAPGLGVPWYTCYGNHDGLVQGNMPRDPAIDGIATGTAKVMSPPPGNPCLLEGGELPIDPTGAPPTPVTGDAERRLIGRAEYAEAHLAAPGLPTGHGLTAQHVADGTLYYATDVGPLRFLVLDTVNPGGFAEGSVGDAQFAWLDAELTRADEAGRLAVLFSHHGLRSLDNPVVTPDPADPSGGDLPRHMADEVEALVASHPSAVLWVNGHTHRNDIAARGGFWDVGTAAHIDWPPQARIVELVDNDDGTLSVFTTLVSLGDDDPVVAFARLLMANDPQGGFGAGDGEATDRNTELLLAHPFRQATPSPTPTPTQTTPPTASSGGSTGGSAASGATPATGGGAPLLTVGGALLVAATAGVRALRRRPAGTGPSPSSTGDA